MKEYVKPDMKMILLKTEERLAASVCSCSGIDKKTGKIFDFPTAAYAG